VAKKYPLTTLHRLRAERVVKSARTFADALRSVETSSQELLRRSKLRDAFEADCARTEKAENARLERGAQTAADLMLRAAFRAGADLERARRTEQVETAREGLAKAEIEADRKRDGVAHAQADAQVVEKNRQKWEAARRDESEKAQEQTVEEAYRSKRRKR
jgi:hypothetical protein